MTTPYESEQSPSSGSSELESSTTTTRLDHCVAQVLADHAIGAPSEIDYAKYERFKELDIPSVARAYAQEELALLVVCGKDEGPSYQEAVQDSSYEEKFAIVQRFELVQIVGGFFLVAALGQWDAEAQSNCMLQMIGQLDTVSFDEQKRIMRYLRPPTSEAAASDDDVLSPEEAKYLSDVGIESKRRRDAEEHLMAQTVDYLRGLDFGAYGNVEGGLTSAAHITLGILRTLISRVVSSVSDMNDQADREMFEQLIPTFIGRNAAKLASRELFRSLDEHRVSAYPRRIDPATLSDMGPVINPGIGKIYQENRAKAR